MNRAFISESTNLHENNDMRASSDLLKSNYFRMNKSVVSKRRSLAGIAFLFAILSILNSCKKNSDLPGPNEVFIQGGAFDPGTITVAANTTITWTNKDGVAHTVTSNTGLFESGTISINRIWSHKFETAGSYPYHCTIHPSMTATVIVN